MIKKLISQKHNKFNNIYKKMEMLLSKSLSYKEKNDKVLTDYKYATFDDPIMNNQLKTDITYDNLLCDIQSVLDLQKHCHKLYSNLILNNTNNILDSFEKYKININNINVYIQLLHRMNYLIGRLIQAKFSKEEDISTIEYEIKENYIEINEDNVIEQIVKDQKEVKDEHINLIKQGLEKEKTLININKSPSICGIGVAMKYYKILIEEFCMNLQIVTEQPTEEKLLDFFSHVLIFLIIYLK
jgi:hypothetical protein